MNLEKEKLDIYRDLLHGKTIKLDELYEICQDCAIEKAKPYIGSQTILIHDLSETSDRHNALIISTNSLPYVTTMTTRELLQDYEDKHHGIFEKVKVTMMAFDQEKNYKTPYVSKECIFISPTGSSKQEANFFNIMHLDSLRKMPNKKTILSFSNYLDIEDDFDKKIYDKSVHLGIRYYFSYFYLDYKQFSTDIPYVTQAIQLKWLGEYINHHIDIMFKAYKQADTDYMTQCQEGATRYLYAKAKDPSLSIAEYFEDHLYL